MSEVSERILAKTRETVGKMNDYDQRSALGMARSWVKHGKLDTWNPERHQDMIQYPVRDQLATDLVAIFEELDATRDEQVKALAGARAWVNAPFVDPTMLGQQNRARNPKPKEKKGKNE